MSAEIHAMLAVLKAVEQALEPTPPAGHVLCRVICCECKTRLPDKYLIGTEPGVSHGLCSVCYDKGDDDATD